MTNAEARFNNSLRPRKPEGSLGRTAQDGHLDSHTAPELWEGWGNTQTFNRGDWVTHRECDTFRCHAIWWNNFNFNDCLLRTWQPFKTCAGYKHVVITDSGHYSVFLFPPHKSQWAYTYKTCTGGGTILNPYGCEKSDPVAWWSYPHFTDSKQTSSAHFIRWNSTVVLSISWTRTDTCNRSEWFLPPSAY